MYATQSHASEMRQSYKFYVCAHIYKLQALEISEAGWSMTKALGVLPCVEGRESMLQSKHAKGVPDPWEKKPSGFCINLAYRKPSEKVANDDHMTLGCCNCHRCEPIAKCPDHDHMWLLLQQELLRTDKYHCQ